ncbi:MAG: hypothetical protein RL525_522 [Bacteroidota bacterium]
MDRPGAPINQEFVTDLRPADEEVGSDEGRHSAEVQGQTVFDVPGVVEVHFDIAGREIDQGKRADTPTQHFSGFLSLVF